MKMKTLSVVVGVFAASHAFANVDDIVVTGTYSPVTAAQLTASVTVINHAQLLALSSHSLVDALRQVPSIWVEEQGGPGGLTYISLRGAESNHTLVLLDGVEINDPTNTRGGAFDVHNINIESIKRIEIIRGAQSPIYGSDALAGVIQIITTEPTKTSEQMLTANIGDGGYKTASVTASGSLDGFGYAAKVQTKDAGQPLEGSSAKDEEVITKLNWKQGAHSVDFSYRYFDGRRTNFPEQSGGPLFALSRDLDHSQFTDQNSAINWHWQVNDMWRSTTQVSWYNRSEDMTSPGIIPYNAVPPNGANTDFTRRDFTWINTFGNEKKLWANIGIEAKKESGISTGYLNFGELMPTDFALQRRTNSAFINTNAFVTGDLLVQASIRRDATQHTDAKNTVQVGARYSISEQLSWLVNSAQGYKLPSFAALGHPLVGNPNLKPETSKTLDTGLEWSFVNTSANLSLFKNRYRDLIDFDSDTFKNVNRSIVDSEGAEIEIHWHSLDSQWLLGAHASYIDIDAEKPLLGRPQFKAGSSLGYTINESWQINANCVWVRERLAVSRYSGDGVMKTLDAYTRLDGSIKWSINPQVNVTISAENLADTTYFNDIGFQALGRTGYIGIIATF